MKKQNNKNSKNLNYVFICVALVIAGILGYCSANLKNSYDQEFLNLRKHLLSRFVELKFAKDHQVCEMEKDGLSKDNDVYARFWCQNHDPNTHEPIGEKIYHTLYFQRPKDSAFGYAEALGD